MGAKVRRDGPTGFVTVLSSIYVRAPGHRRVLRAVGGGARRKTLAGNLASVAGLTWCAVRYVNETGGRIVNVTSRGAYRGETRHPAYGRARPACPRPSGPAGPSWT